MIVKNIVGISACNFFVYNEALYIFDEENKSIIYENKDTILTNKRLFYLLICENLLHINSNIFYDLTLKKEIIIDELINNEKDYIECVILDNKMYIKKFIENGEIIFYRKLKDKLEVLNHIGNPMIINASISIELIENIIQCINNKNITILWQQPFSNLTGEENNRVSSTILENNGKIYLSISSKGKSGLFVLDIDTGKELAFYENAYDFLVKDGNYIYSYKGEFCILKIDTITNELEEIPLKNVLLANGFDPNTDLRRSTVKGNKIYFTEFLYKPYSRLGVINLDTKEMLYTYNFQKGNGAIGSIQVSGNRIFVHTQDNTLHIFEKEETA